MTLTPQRIKELDEGCGNDCGHSDAEHTAFNLGLETGEANDTATNPYLSGDNDLIEAWEAGYSVGTLNRQCQPNIVQGVKLWKMNECDWWAGATREEVIAAFLEEHDYTSGDGGAALAEADGLLDGEVRELTAEELNTLTFVDGDDPIRADGKPGGKITFRSALRRVIRRGDKLPAFFASTEY